MQVKLNTTFLLPFTLKTCWLCTDICRLNFSHISNWTKNLILVYNDIGHLFILLNIYTWFIKQYDIGGWGWGILSWMMQCLLIFRASAMPFTLFLPNRGHMKNPCFWSATVQIKVWLYVLMSIAATQLNTSTRHIMYL